MRMVVVIAVVLLVSGCSASDGGQAEESPVSTSPVPTDPSPTHPVSPAPTGPPPAGAPVAAVLAWVQSGTQADPGGFHTATREDVTTDLGEDVAFVTPAGKTQCRAASGGPLACLVELAEPPTQPADISGQWIGNWVDFDGPTAQVGSVHGDPGPFTTGTGAELAYGSALRFGDYQCRTDPVGLFCVNFARQTALQMSDAGVVPFGCLREVTPPADAGVRYECG